MSIDPNDPHPGETAAFEAGYSPGDNPNDPNGSWAPPPDELELYDVVFTIGVQVQAKDQFDAREQATTALLNGEYEDDFREYAVIDRVEKVPDDPPCRVCGVYPGDPHNPEAHVAEMRADEYASYERQFEPDDFDPQDDPNEDD